ncbi:MAG: CpsD/CapB family tyrosine-protein kinase [Clostridia bacterium]|nr:CpsD/CapB family tyrosine-protein kinase [Clostridia bacterium]
MKVLFAVSNENISDSIVKKYQKDYKEIISYKNVYYFNAILKEIQRDKTYDRIVISEDLEPFANNDYEAIDRFIFDKLDSISDEATDTDGGDTPIILICSDRRAKSEQLLVKLFSIGVYSALLGQDRSIDEVCKLIRKPRTKKEAKIYYKIESEDAKYQEENEDTVSEVEIQNIRAHYKKLGKNEEAYVESFNNIAAQYTDSQLRVIVKFLPLNVKAVLETNSPKYQSIMSFAGGSVAKQVKKETKKEDAIKIDFIENQLNKPKMTKPVIVPSAVHSDSVTKLSRKTEKTQTNNDNSIKSIENNTNNNIQQNSTQEVSLQDLLDEELVVTPKRGRGRPKKTVNPEQEENKVATPKRGRGRPKKIVEPVEEIEEVNPVNLFDLDEEDEKTILPGVEEVRDVEENILPGFDLEEQPIVSQENEYNQYEEINSYRKGIIEQNDISQNVNIESLLSKDKKVVTFVGTSKNGTSFLVNNLAELFSNMGINTAILDVTKNKNSYYIYTKNEEELRKVAFNSMSNLEKDIAQGIKVNNNLTVYTSLPAENVEVNPESVLATLVKNYSLVLIDTDFDTPISYFANSQEIYLVQSMDILTIQPLTAFLRDLKSKNILLPEKLRVVINKETRIRGLNPKVIIGGMAFYNAPAMTFMTELFNKDNIKYTTIPFDEQTYSRYLEALVNCKISLNGYDKNFMQALKTLANMVYPLLGNKYKPVDNYNSRDSFSSQTNNVIEQMKRKF